MEGGPGAEAEVVRVGDSSIAGMNGWVVLVPDWEVFEAVEVGKEFRFV